MRHSVKLLLSILFLMVTLCANAQEKKAENDKDFYFRSFNSIHLLYGKATQSVLVQSVNGINCNKWFAGVGVGADFYFHPSFPLFIEGQYKIAESKNSLSLLADAGLNIPVQKLNTKFESSVGPYKPGLYYNAGLQYEIAQSKLPVIIGAGTVYKQFIQMAENNTWNPELNRVENIPIKKDYRLSRLYMKIGLVF